MAERIRIVQRSEIPAGTGKVVVADGRVLAVFNVEGQFRAVENTCPHRGGPLGEGSLEGAVVTCPWHGWQFDVCTGASPRNPSVSVRCVPLEVQGDDVFLLTE
jgi:nitrite reductase/ring-hydroxylating ferredoxin subunit